MNDWVDNWSAKEVMTQAIADAHDGEERQLVARREYLGSALTLRTRIYSAIDTATGETYEIGNF